VTRVSVDMDTCINSGMCTSLASSVFAMNESARLVLIKVDLDDEVEAEKVRNAVACCPVEAITIEDSRAS
jgi:ferredoxin